jgi:hypothetical protein
LKQESTNGVDVRLKQRLKRVLVLSLRYVIPGLATATGLLAWWVNSAGYSPDSPELTLPPSDEYPPITIQIEVPAIPIDDGGLGLYTPQGDASCLKDSTKSARALNCEVGGKELDPCYWAPGDAEINEVYCFDPSSYDYTRHRVVEILDIWALKEQGVLWESTAVATFLFITPPDYAFQEYGDQLIDGLDVCVLDNFDSSRAEVKIYKCNSGATVQSEVYGDLPHLFARYSSPSADRVSSEWIKYIIYG